MDGSCLLRFLSKHPTEIDLMKEEVSDSGRTKIFAIMEEFQVQNVSSYQFVLVISRMRSSSPKMFKVWLVRMERRIRFVYGSDRNFWISPTCLHFIS